MIVYSVLSEKLTFWEFLLRQLMWRETRKAKKNAGNWNIPGLPWMLLRKTGVCVCVAVSNATHRNTLQHAATHCNNHCNNHCNCNTLQHTFFTTDVCYLCSLRGYYLGRYVRLQHNATHCNTLQHTATHCNSLHLTAPHCNTLQHTATHIQSYRSLLLVFVQRV